MVPVPATAVQHAAVWVIHHLRMVIPTVRAHAIGHVPVRVHNRHVHRQHTVAVMAASQHLGHSIMVVRAQQSGLYVICEW